jgi:hypothetical protein
MGFKAAAKQYSVTNQGLRSFYDSNMGEVMRKPEKGSDSKQQAPPAATESTSGCPDDDYEDDTW